ncbi:DUF4255 domain-containing protein [Halosquirtibacter laminarini]|uniref:DUF4255 domain-containing protein n=1 Tax=Halosquirtibacter laminarini TaxID=3374600 RepID=A0AC61NFJ8_9BACT|nr:DUF4255 domain-containing protein [Prolixibacteraceae bacterium]
MILETLRVIQYKLNSFLKQSFALTEDLVVLSNISTFDGGMQEEEKNKIILTLVNIEEESFAKKPVMTTEVKSSPVFLNLDIMISASFENKNYNDALTLISYVITFFQCNSVFDYHNIPKKLYHKNIDKIIVGISNLSFSELVNLWGMLGSKYIPSVLYKVRMVKIDGNQMVAEIPEITSLKPNTIKKQ